MRSIGEHKESYISWIIFVIGAAVVFVSLIGAIRSTASSLDSISASVENSQSLQEELLE